MSLADQLLIGWWVAIIVVPAILFVLFRRNDRRDVEETTVSYFRGVSLRELRYPRPLHVHSVEAFFGIFLLVIAAVLVIFFFVIVWMQNETRLYLWSIYLLWALVGLGLITRAFAQEPPGFYGPFHLRRMWYYQPRPGSLQAKAMRTLNFAFGSLMFGFASFLLVNDVVFPWSVIEGRIDIARIHRDYIGSPDYKVVIDGRWYETTNEVFSTLRIGDRVRAEMGTGSKRIFRARPTSVTSR